MNTEGFKLRLTAILSADVEGYSRLMNEDEAATVKTLETYKGGSHVHDWEVTRSL